MYTPAPIDATDFLPSKRKAARLWRRMVTPNYPSIVRELSDSADTTLGLGHRSACDSGNPSKLRGQIPDAFGNRPLPSPRFRPSLSGPPPGLSEAGKIDPPSPRRAR
jgi:hypothetical protein